MRLFFLFFIVFSSCTIHFCAAQTVLPGASNLDAYLPLLKNKQVGIFANQTSVIPNQRQEYVHLIDTLLKKGIQIKRIFGPEHGFRGNANAGEKIANYIDATTGIQVISLYGSKQKPSVEDLAGIDILIFDIQDVGVRFYTYISSLQLFMEAAFEHHIPLILLDRPNPNGFYVDGPVLEKKYQSFVGMQPVPIVYGMTIGEYAQMLIGEKWLSKNALSKYHIAFKNYQNRKGVIPFLIVKNQNYTHNIISPLPVNPSPNLASLQSILLYPSICLFEGTTLSEGRGTDQPFQIFGAPSLPKTLFSFVPKPNSGAQKSKHFGDTCYGWNLSGSVDQVRAEINGRLQLKWLINAYELFPNKNDFFIVPASGNMEQSFFNKLAGNNKLWSQIKNGISEDEIRKSWEPQLSVFKKIRKKYLLYPDFD